MNKELNSSQSNPQNIPGNLIGEKLKKIRESKGLSLEDIFQHTKVNVKILKNIERSAFDDLPNLAFIKGFVHNYAKCLGLNPEEAKLQLEQNYLQRKNRAEKSLATNLDSKDRNENNDKIKIHHQEILHSLKKEFQKLPWGKIIVFSLFFLLIVIFVKAGIDFFKEVQKESVTQVSGKDYLITDQKKDETLIENDNDNLANSPLLPKEKSLFESTKTQEKLNPENSKAKDEDKLKEETKDGKFPFIKFSPITSPLYSLNSSSPLLNNPLYIPTSIKSSLINGKANVYINAINEDTWISYKVDSEEIKRYVLQKERAVFLRGDKILLFLGNINATAIFYNNQLVETQSKTGVKTLIFPELIQKDYEIPIFPLYNGTLYTADEYKENMAKE